MPVTIRIDQSGKPAGVTGRAREDLDTGTAVTLNADGGPFLQYLWSIIDRPINEAMTARATSALSAATAATTNLSPIDVEGTYLVQVQVDSGNGLGALPGDVASITFYAGTPTTGVLNTDPSRLPRREPAFRERTEHNVPDSLDPAPTGNPRGWAKELGKWIRLIRRLASTNNPASVTPNKTALYTTKDGEVVCVDPSGGAFVVNLPLVSAMSPGGSITVRNVTTSTNAVTITAAGSDTILNGDTGTTYIVNTSKGYVTLVADPNTAPDRWLTFPGK